MAIGFSSAYTITYISPMNGSIYINETPFFNATIDIPYVNVGMSFNGIDDYVGWNNIDINQYEQGLNNWSVVFYGDSDDYYGDLIYFYYYDTDPNPPQPPAPDGSCSPVVYILLNMLVIVFPIILLIFIFNIDERADKTTVRIINTLIVTIIIKLIVDSIC